MHKLLIVLLGASAALFVVACSKPAPEPEAVSEAQPGAAEQTEAPDAAEKGGGDPAVVDPDHYTVEFENDAVRILRIKYGPGDESVMHSHPESVAARVERISRRTCLTRPGKWWRSSSSHAKAVRASRAVPMRRSWIRTTTRRNSKTIPCGS